MHHSIQQFIEQDIIKFQKKFAEILSGEADTDDLSKAVHAAVLKLGRNLLTALYEGLDEEIRTSAERKKDWHVARRNEPKELLDIMGPIRYKRTGYVNKKTGKYAYLSDRLLRISAHQRLTLGSSAKILEEATRSSYSRGGMQASSVEGASKQTVKKLVHETDALLPAKPAVEKKKMRYLHIVADEDHVAAQFWKQKGDLENGASGQKINTIQAKLICLYEDVINLSGEKSKNPRYALTGKKYFSGVYAGTKKTESCGSRLQSILKRCMTLMFWKECT
jgi:hypothetical protein